MHAQDEETEVTPSVQYVDSEATTEEVDLFNNQGRILITNIPNGMWEERLRCNAPIERWALADCLCLGLPLSSHGTL